MNKRIIFFMLVITSTIAHGMKRPQSLENDNTNNNALLINSVSQLLQADLLPQLTAGICRSNNYQPQSIQKDIRALSNTNKKFHDYYAQEKTKQEIIDLCLPYHNSNSKDIARDLGCHAIHDKIERLTDIVRDQRTKFEQNDLTDPWYFAVTTTYNDYNVYQAPLNQSLLYVAIDNWNLKKAITILKNTEKLYFNYEDQQNPLLKIAKYRHTLSHLAPQKSFQQLLTITEGLFQKKINPNGYETNTEYTPLLYSVLHADTEMVQLLLEHGANPELKGYNRFSQKEINAFDLEPHQGWLQTIIDEVTTKK